MQTAPQNFTHFDIPKSWNVPRGTNEKLLTYCDMLQHWNSAINLVSSKELQKKDQFLQRHILDSLQLCEYIKPNTKIVDMGSGGGLPALILAAAGYAQITCIESDARKCAFLSEAARHMDAYVTVINKRIENVKTEDLGSGPITFTARAFAAISEILKITQHIQDMNSEYFLLKGKLAHDEIKSALQDYQFDYEIKSSSVSEEGNIVILRNIKNSEQ